jgi:hypothetical protein
MARPRKINLEGETIEMENSYGSVKQMVRRISQTNTTTDNTKSVFDVDAELEEWYKLGYTLKYVTMLGIEPESINVFYVLAKA